MDNIEEIINELVEKYLKGMNSNDMDYRDYNEAASKYSEAIGVRKNTLGMDIFMYINSSNSVLTLDDGRKFSLKGEYNNVLPVKVTPLQSD